MAVELGEMSRLDPRHVWQSEAFAFTPWLADRIEILGQALGMDLEFVARENAVGAFAADIVARDLNRDRVVLIENQLEGTDHGHLGQLITYAAGLDATTIVWISREMREEHRQALDWLNRRTDTETEFFGVVLELLQIDQSRPAANFRAVAFPNSWSRTRRAAPGSAAPSLTDRQTAYQQFFQRLLDELRDRHRFTNARAGQPQNWYIFASGTRGIVYGVSFGTGNRLRAEIYIDAGDGGLNRAILDELRERAGSSEIMPGEVLEWEPLQGKRACRVAVYRPNSNILASEDEQREMQRWTVERLLRLKEMFGPKLSSAVAAAQERVAAEETATGEGPDSSTDVAPD